MDRETRSHIQHATQAARRLLETEFMDQLSGVHDIRADGHIADGPGAHLRDDPDALRARGKLVTAVHHHLDLGRRPADAVAALLRECAFTTLNRFVALKMLEARGIVQECVSKGPQSSGFREFVGLATGLTALPDQGYRLYLDSLFDEIGREVRVLFDRRDPASLLWPRKPALDALIAELGDSKLASVWREDETIGWVYQYFNGDDERRQMRAESQAPRNSRELAVRNQFFTPRYVVEFLTDNTLARTWLEMRQGDTALAERCQYLVRRPGERFLAEGEAAPPVDESLPVESRPVVVPFRAKKDPRDLKVLDPACGSGHFLLYSFDVLITVYHEGWADPHAPPSELTGRRLADDYPTRAELDRALPGLVLRHNLHGVDIDPRAAQIAALALWMRAQRAWNEFGVRRADRPLVTRTNIVVAEPMPGEADLLDDLCRGLDSSVAAIVRAVFDDMALAGEAGTLLRIEDTVRRGLEQLAKLGTLFREDDTKRWRRIEDQIYGTLRRYAESAGGTGYRKRLFAEDAARGFAFIEVCRKRYDVVLMNPPFGAGSDALERALERAYPLAARELAASFVQRGRELAGNEGSVGVLSTRKPFYIKTYCQWRARVLDEGRAVSTFADLGRGVLDATVEAAAYVLVGRARSSAWCCRAFTDGMVVDDVAASLRSTIADGACLPVFLPSAEMFSRIPLAPFAYWADQNLVAAYSRLPAFESDGRVASSGASTNDDFRFLRLWTEVAPGRIGLTRDATTQQAKWVSMSKGGEYSPYYRDVELVVSWANDGRELKAFISDLRGAKGWGFHWTAALNGHQDYFRPGVTWSRRTSTWLSARPLPAGCIFGDKGPAAFVVDDKITELYHVIGWLNSAPVGALLALSIGKDGAVGTAQSNSYEVGIVERLPYLSTEEADALARLAQSASAVRQSLARHGELNRHFCNWHARDPESVRDSVANALRAQVSIDSFATRAYGADPRDEELLASSRTRTLDPDDPYEPLFRASDDDSSDLVAWALGLALGRFDIRLATGERPPPPVPDPFDPLPPCSPGMLTGDDGLPVAAPPRGYPIRFPTDGILVDDPGAARDVVARIAQVFDVVFAESGDDRLREAVEVLDPGATDLRGWLRRSFFEEHIQRYSKSRRKAPIYWRLGTPSGSYSVWLYLHRTGPDTLHAVLRDHVEPKLTFEVNRLATLEMDAGDSPAPSQRRVIAAQQTFVDELSAFRDELRRVAPLWNPDLDDGVVINASFLHRLFAHTRAWQRECETHWRALQAGEYDWAHLAMRLWPERVMPKCAADRSLAIAHGLEADFWHQDENGRWQARLVAAETVARLVAERSSPAVKAALEPTTGLAEAPRARAPRRATAPAPAAAPRPTAPPAPVQLGLGLEATGRERAAMDALRDALRRFPDGAGKAELLASTGLDEAGWRPGIDGLLAQGEIRQTGQKRGARYHLVETA